MGYSIKKIIVQTLIVIVICFIWMIIIGSIASSSQMLSYWLVGSIVIGYFYLKYAERNGYLSD